LLVVSDRLDHGNNVGGGYDGDTQGFGNVVNNQFFICPQ